MDPWAETARWAAAARARETRRPDRLFEDPWAELLAGDAVAAGSEAAGGPAAGDSPNLVIRTRFFDDLLVEAARARRIRQVVVVAAGLDTRAFRLDWPVGTRLFELDRSQLLEAKDQLLAATGARPACDRRTVGADLLGAWAELLVGNGFRREQPACWLAEGFVVYLTEQEVGDVLRQLSELSAAGSRLGLDVPNRAFLTSQWTRQITQAMARRGTPYRFATDEPESLLAEFGWAAEATQLGEEGANYGRWPYPVLPRGALAMPSGFLVTATKVE